VLVGVVAGRWCARSPHDILATLTIKDTPPMAGEAFVLKSNPILEACAAADRKPVVVAPEDGQEPSGTPSSEDGENGFREGRRGIGLKGELKVEVPANSSPESGSSISSPTPPDAGTKISVFDPKAGAQGAGQAPTTPKGSSSQLGSAARAAYNKSVLTPSMLPDAGARACFDDDECVASATVTETETATGSQSDSPEHDGVEGAGSSIKVFGAGDAESKIKVFGAGVGGGAQMEGSITARGKLRV